MNQGNKRSGRGRPSRVTAEDFINNSLNNLNVNANVNPVSTNVNPIAANSNSIPERNTTSKASGDIKPQSKVPEIIPEGYFVPSGIEITLESRKWYNQVAAHWSVYKAQHIVRDMLWKHLQNYENPFREITRILHYALSKTTSTSKFPTGIIIDEFTKHMLNTSDKSSLLDQDIKLMAFHVLLKCREIAKMKKIAETYDLDSISSEILEIARCMIREKHLKEACQVATVFPIAHNFTVHDFVIPLILQDKLPIVEDFLATNVNFQVETIKALDQFYSGESSFSARVIDYIHERKIEDYKSDKIDGKPMGKLLKRLMRNYKLPLNAAPNFHFVKSAATVRFLIKTKYIDNTIDEVSWTQMLNDVVQESDDQLKIHLIQQIAYFDSQCALQWALKLQVDRIHWPSSILNLKLDVHATSDSSHTAASLPKQSHDLHVSELSWINPSEIDPGWGVTVKSTVENENDGLYHMKIPLANIIFIDTIDGFERFLNDGLKDVTIIGIDSEWRMKVVPSTGGYNDLSIIQFATFTHVYILDALYLKNRAYDLWLQLIDKLLFNNKILKIGFSFGSDLTIMHHSIPALNFDASDCYRFLDLSALWKNLRAKSSFYLSETDDKIDKGKSLSSLVEQVLNVKLDKFYQISDWERRPLGHKQIIYAASDTYCMLDVYRVLKERAAVCRIDFESVCEKSSIQNLPGKRMKKDRKSEGKRAVSSLGYPPYLKESLDPSRTRVVCEGNDLARYLRLVGFDTVQVRSLDTLDDVKGLIRSDCVVVGDEKSYDKIMVLTDNCFKILSDDSPRSQLIQFLMYFNVCDLEYLFTRCPICNNTEIGILNQNDIVKLQNSKRQPDRSDDQSKTESIRQKADDNTWFFVDNPSNNAGSSDDSSGLSSLTKSGASIKVTDALLNDVKNFQMFHLCENCGHIFYDKRFFDAIFTNEYSSIYFAMRK